MDLQSDLHIHLRRCESRRKKAEPFKIASFFAEEQISAYLHDDKRYISWFSNNEVSLLRLRKKQQLKNNCFNLEYVRIFWWSPVAGSLVQFFRHWV